MSVYEELARRIEDGQFAAGARLPSEPELATEMGVSRATLRDALRILEDDGLVRRMQGSGTFVTPRLRVSNSLDVNFGVTDAIRAAGMRAGISEGRHWIEPAGVSEAERLNIDPGEDVLVVERIRTADEKPVVLSRDVLPQKVVDGHPDVVRQMLTESIYSVLERDLGIVIHHGVASFRPVHADRSLASTLAVPRAALLLYLWQVDYAESGDPMLSSHEYHLADAFDFSVVRRGPGRRLT
ncbi:MAG TPA: GntR family transcriptional regulator [Streptosporangiaceae bacterium]